MNSYLGPESGSTPSAERLDLPSKWFFCFGSLSTTPKKRQKHDRASTPAAWQPESWHPVSTTRASPQGDEFGAAAHRGPDASVRQVCAPRPTPRSRRRGFDVREVRPEKGGASKGSSVARVQNRRCQLQRSLWKPEPVGSRRTTPPTSSGSDD